MAEKGFRIGNNYFFPHTNGIAVVPCEDDIFEEKIGTLKREDLCKLERKARRDLTNYVREVTPDEVLILLREIRFLREENGSLKSEVSGLKEQVREFIPRRRVRRIYQQVKKILEQDGIVDDLDVEE